jgi:subtilisin family serine protease/subtilisin-like proprotein convertase family protein
MSGRHFRRRSLLDILMASFRKERSGTRRTQKATGPSFPAVESLESRIVLSAQYVPNHVLLGLDQTAATPVQLDQVVKSTYSGSKIEPLGSYGVFLVTLPSGVDAMDAISSLRNRPGVKYAEPDWIGEWLAIPNDPNFNRMWGMRNVGQIVNGVAGTFNADIDANLAWDTTTGSKNVKVAIVDSGMDYLHPDLAANVWTNTGEIPGNGIDDDGNGYIDDIHGYDFASGDADPMDFVGHGTHVSGTVGAVGNNGVGTVGVNWNVSLMALKIGTDLGGPTNAGAIAAINYAVAMGAAVSTHSYTVNPTQALQDAIINAQANNHIIVAAAGNSATNIDQAPSFPASYPQDNIISVAATDQNDLLAGFSNYGVVSVDIGAPGVNIWSTTPRAGSLFYNPNYDFSDGTSMATPMVAGAVALLRSVSPTSSYTTIINALYTGSDKIASMNGRVSSGGRLNVNNALQQLAVATISISPGSIREDAGASAAFITVTRRNFPIDQPLNLDLFYDDPTEVYVPLLAGGSAITIPAGQTQIVIPVNAVDDTLLDGTQTVTFDLHHNGSSIATATLLVTDVEPLTISVSPGTVREDAGAGAGTITVTRGNTDTLPPNTYAVVNNQLLEHNSQGTLVSTRNIPWPTGPRPAGQRAHDLVTLPNGRVAVYNGSTTAYVSVFNPTTTTWQHFFISGLSTDAADQATGGISSWGNYVFVTDMESTSGNPFGVVRLDLTTGATTRFATQSLGYRIFVKDVFGDNILEVSPTTGATLNSIPMPITAAANFGFNNGLAFDGTNLWLLAGGIGNDQIYKLNPDTGAVLDIHHLGGNTEWDGLGWLNGLLYAQDNFIQNKITVYDPVQRRVVKTLDVGTLNNINISGGLTGITGPDRLISTSTFGDEMYEINPDNGIVTARWNTGMASTEYGVGAAAGEIYVGEFQSGQLKVFSRNGVFQRFVNVNLTPPAGVFAIGGDDVKGMTTTPYRYRDLYAGLDDQLYVLDVAGTAVGRYNPTTLALDRFFDLAVPVNAIATAADGTLWGAGQDGKLYHFSSTGALLGSLATGVAELIDIDLNITGQILLTGRDGTVLKTSTSLAPITSFSTGVLPAFITFGRHQTLPSGALIVTLTNSDPTEISIPTQIIIPAGQQSVTVPFDAVDDRILDGTQTVTITASAVGYIDRPSGTVNVLDVETIGVDILATQIAEDAGNGATQARVYRTNVDGPFPYSSKQTATNSTAQTILDFDKINSYITIPAQTSRLTDVNVTLNLKHTWLADLDIYLISPSGTRVELVTDLNSNEPFMTNTTFDDQAPQSILNGASPFTGKFRPEGKLLDLNGENPSGVWTLEITDDNQQDFGTLFSWSLDIETLGLAPQIVTLSLTGAPGKIGVQQTVTIPANQAEIFIPVNAIDNTLLDGTKVSGIQTSGNAPGYEFGSDTVEVLDRELLTFTINGTTVSEAAGAGALTATLTRFNTDISLPFTVSVSSSNTGKLTVPATVTIPANQTSVTFPIDAVDNAIVDGDFIVTITVSAPAYGPNLTRDVVVEDLEPSLRLSTGTLSVRENAGSFQMTVTRLDQADISQPMVVTLSAKNVPLGGVANLSVPATVTIPANATSVTFTVLVLDNNLLDGTRTAQVDASSAGIIAGSIQIQVTDYETLILTVDKTEFLENAGAKAARGTVRRSNTNIAQPLVVTLTSLDLTEVSVPTTVTIPAGASSVSFDIAAVDDDILDGPQMVSISAAATGYVDGSATVKVLDHEPPVITSPSSTTVDPRPVVKWNAIPGAVRYEVWLTNLSSGVNAVIYNVKVNGTSFTPPENLGIGRYRVWVRAIDSLERADFWSVGKDFKVETAPLITSPVVTGTNASPAFPEIAWTAVADAARYELWVNNLTTGKTQVITKTNLTTTSYRSTEGLGSGTYRAFVRAFNAYGESGLWSNALNFTVLAAPGIIQPGEGGTFQRSPTFTWNAIPGAANYDLWVTSRTLNKVVIRNQYVLGTAFKAPADLAIGDYTVWVRAQSGNYFSPWSAPRNFSVGTAPVILTPASNSTPGNKPEFNWSGIAGTERYELWVTNLTTNVRVLYLTNLTTTKFTPPTALPAGQYRVWVRAVSTMGEITAWSAGVDFRVTLVTEPESPTGLAPLLASRIDVTPVRSAAVVTASESNRDDDYETASDAEVNVNDYFAVLVSESDTPASSEIDAAYDNVMAGWDASEWWTVDESALTVPVASTKPRRQSRVL